jgi:IclR family transcriptional regulator, acetate operon repressor
VSGIAQHQQSGSVQSVERTLDLLEVMAGAGGELSLSEAAARAGLPLPTIHRLIRTLVARGYVRQLPSRRYALGPRLINLGETASAMLADWSRPWLAKLVAALGETANLSMIDGDRATYIAQVPSPHAMRMFTEVGRRVPLHSTGVGKALMAQLSDEEVTVVIGRAGLPAATEHTITDPNALRRELVRTRRQGYAIDDGEQDIGVRCVAVPILDAPSSFAISVSGPAARMNTALVNRAVPLLQSAAADLGADLAAADRPSA